MNEQRVKVGMNVIIKERGGRYETHNVLEVEENPYNEFVPHSFTTCCGKYLPTSSMDGRWEKGLLLGGWDIEK